jgi:hypothetical protein
MNIMQVNKPPKREARDKIRLNRSGTSMAVSWRVKQYNNFMNEMNM